jgi:hypothetical protein
MAESTAAASFIGWLMVNAEAPIDVAPEDNPTNQPVPDLIVLKPDYAGF